MTVLHEKQAFAVPIRKRLFHFAGFDLQRPNPASGPNFGRTGTIFNSTLNPIPSARQEPPGVLKAQLDLQKHIVSLIGRT